MVETAVTVTCQSTLKLCNHATFHCSVKLNHNTTLQHDSLPNLKISFSQIKYIIVITNILTLESTLYRIYTILHVSYILYFMRLLVLQSTRETQREFSASDAVNTKTLHCTFERGRKQKRETAICFEKLHFYMKPSNSTCVF